MNELRILKKPAKRVDISINMEKTGANIRKLIKGSGYSVRDIMAITGISTEQAVYKWYRGESIPAIETMLILCNTLEIGVDELLVVDGDFYFLTGAFTW
ncbi:MAG: helix-turn-helix transcriptional regulator [Eubacterium sp.]|nr:helix-turn-helix transcriptional regulator [Eubacterium sp.]